jgi:hypothetical protein
VSGIHAVRVAARLRRELNTDVDLVKGRYGEFKILVDDKVVIDGGALVTLGIMPSGKKAVETVRPLLAKA